jgi:hypothetical protein
VLAPDGFPLWVSQVEPGSVHDITAARAHALPALYPAAAAGLPALADPGYEGAGIGILIPVKQPPGGRKLDVNTRIRNALQRSLRCLGERGFALLTGRWRRHGTTTLFAALEVATGKVTDACYPRHRSDEFLRFLKKVARAYSRTELHIVADNYATRKHPKVMEWLKQNLRVTLHFTPTGCSWLNMVPAATPSPR